MAPTDGMEEEQKAAPKKPQPHNAGDIRSGQLKPASSVKKAQQRSAADVKRVLRNKRVEARKAFIAEHTVAPGDSLSSISKKYYDSAYHYPLIYEANKDVIGDDPNMIIEGTVLKIPKLPDDKK